METIFFDFTFTPGFWCPARAIYMDKRVYWFNDEAEAWRFAAYWGLI